MRLSVVTPIYNESGNIEALYSELVQVLPKIAKEYEIVAVNDGSKDNSLEILKDLAKKDKRLKIVNFKSNSGQTAALQAGISLASGEIIVTMDSDLENSPQDISRLVDKLNEGFDVVSGWRKARWSGKLFSRKFPSVMANYLISKITGLKLHDYGCILKAYKKDLIKGVKLYGEMHRFIPAYAMWQGAKVAELEVSYQPRRFGKSNYGLGRIFKVILDLLLIRFLDKYFNRPIHFFGGVGLISFLIGVVAGLLALILKIFQIRDLVSTPLPILSALFLIVGVQLAAMGILGEVLMRIYYESKNSEPYTINERINF